MDSSFDDREKRFILSEMIKASHIDIGAVIGFVKHYGISPNWLEMQIPHGRTINQCMQAAASMGIETPPNFAQQNQPPHFQQQGPHYPQQHQILPAKQIQIPGKQYAAPPQQHQQHQQPQPFSHQQSELHQSLPLPGPLRAPGKRKTASDSNEHVPKRQAVSPVDMNVAPQTRSIQPRPAPANGVASVRPAPGAVVPPGQIVPRKRGRPSRQDKLVQAQNARLSSNPFPFLAPASKPPPTATPLASKPPKAYNYGQSVEFSPKLPPRVVYSPAAGVAAEGVNVQPSEQSRQSPLKREISPVGPVSGSGSDNPPPEPQKVTSKPGSPATENTPPRTPAAISSIVDEPTQEVVTTGV